MNPGAQAARQGASARFGCRARITTGPGGEAQDPAVPWSLVVAVPAPPLRPPAAPGVLASCRGGRPVGFGLGHTGASTAKKRSGSRRSARRHARKNASICRPRATRSACAAAYSAGSGRKLRGWSRCWLGTNESSHSGLPLVHYPGYARQQRKWKATFDRSSG
jgi:hypothetical protein